MLLFYVLSLPVLTYTLHTLSGQNGIRPFLRDTAMGLLIAVPFILVYWPLSGVVPGGFDVGASFTRHLLSTAVYPVVLSLGAAYLAFGLRIPEIERLRAFLAGFFTLLATYDALVFFGKYDFYFLFLRPVILLSVLLLLATTVRLISRSWGYRAILFGLAGATVIAQSGWVAVLYYHVMYLYAALVFLALLAAALAGVFFLDREA